MIYGLKDKFYAGSRAVIHFGMDLFGNWEFKTKGIENLPGKAIIAANHQSYFDAVSLVYGVYNRPVYFLVANSIGEYPLIKRFLAMQNHIILEEGLGVSTFKRLVNKVEDRLERGYVGIFPEGRINPFHDDIIAGKLGKLERGVNTLARMCKVPIVPAAIWGTYQICPRPQEIPNRTGKVTISIGKPIDYQEPQLLGTLSASLTSLLKTEIDSTDR